MKRKVFILGDSRTGTTTLHKFMKIAGLRSIHYFFKESGVSESALADYENNWSKLTTFIDNSNYDAFSDYPIRTFYRDLFEKYPNSIFILSTRKDTETWRKSMLSFFSKFDIEIDIDSLTKSYTNINEEIRKLAHFAGSELCEICIDDDSETNGQKLSKILELEIPMALGWENKTDAYDNNLWSTRVTIFNTSSDDVLDYVKRATYPSKAMLSEHGWVFLINDSSDFMEFLYGDERWDGSIVERATTILAKRRAELKQRNIEYLKFVIPEKSIIYPEYMPKIFSGKKQSLDRPATLIDDKKLDHFRYLNTVLADAKSLGQLYFRGDSHTNWLGSYFAYYSIVTRMNEVLPGKAFSLKPPLSLAELVPFLASYGGDLYSQLDPEMKNLFNGAWRPLNLGEKLEYVVGLKLSDANRSSKMLDTETAYQDKITERPTFRFENRNVRLPRAVIFRDSTSDFLVDLLAEHFSSSLFIWHKGFVFEDIVERESADIVLHIMAERFLTQYKNVKPFYNLFD